MSSETTFLPTEEMIQAGAQRLLEELGHEMPGLWDLWVLKERNIEDAASAIWQAMHQVSHN